jgi:integrase
VAVLREWQVTQARERDAWGPAWQRSGYVFTREDGAPLHPESVTGRFLALARAAGLPPIRLHDLRHGAASIMLAAGVPAKVVSETLGHSTVRLTLDTYTSVYSAVSISAAEDAARAVPRRVRRSGIISASSNGAGESAGCVSAGEMVGRVGLEPTT